MPSSTEGKGWENLTCFPDSFSCNVVIRMSVPLHLLGLPLFAPRCCIFPYDKKLTEKAMGLLFSKYLMYDSYFFLLPYHSLN